MENLVIQLFSESTEWFTPIGYPNQDFVLVYRRLRNKWLQRRNKPLLLYKDK